MDASHGQIKRYNREPVEDSFDERQPAVPVSRDRGPKNTGKKLVRDAWNLRHISKHDALAGEVKEVATSDPLGRATYKGRL